MNIRSALISQSPSLLLIRAAADEIAKLDDIIRHYNQLREIDNQRMDWLKLNRPAVYAEMIAETKPS